MIIRNGVAMIPAETNGDPAASRALPGADGDPLNMELPSERMLAVAQFKGQLKAQSVEKIGQMVSQNPADSVAVLRTWIHEKAAA
jgi:flagellar M-ring protein FliF